MSQGTQFSLLSRRKILGGLLGGTASIILGPSVSPSAATPDRPESEDESIYDWSLFTDETLGRIELRVHDAYADHGPVALRLTRWAQEIVQQYREIPYAGLARIWLYPPGGEEMLEEIGNQHGGVAVGFGDEMDIYMSHPEKLEMDTLLGSTDPRLDSPFFRTLMHEYIHAESYWMMPTMPGWFEHGFTEFTTKNHQQSYYETVLEDLADDQLMSLETVEEETGGYAYGLFVMKHLVFEHGMDAVVDLYHKMAENYDQYRDVRTEAAFENVLGEPFDEFEANFQESLHTWFDDFDGTATTIDGRIYGPDAYLRREENEPGIEIGTPPDVEYEHEVESDDEDENADEERKDDTADGEREDERSIEEWGDELEDALNQSGENDDDMPGFGILATVTAIGSGAYIFASNRDGSESTK